MWILDLATLSNNNLTLYYKYMHVKVTQETTYITKTCDYEGVSVCEAVFRLHIKEKEPLCSYVSEWVSKALRSEPITTKCNRCQMRIIYHYCLRYKDAMFISSKQSSRRPITLSFGSLPIYIGPFKCCVPQLQICPHSFLMYKENYFTLLYGTKRD
jgi:hypothetical protein